MFKHKKPWAGLIAIKFSYQFILMTSLSLLVAGFAIGKEPGDTGIRVHGNWIITITNPDGTISQERAFQNALVTSGATMLTGLLTNTRSFPSWQVSADTTGLPDIFPDCSTATIATIAEFPLHATTYTINGDFTVPESCVGSGSYSIVAVNSTITVNNDDPRSGVTGFSDVFSTKVLDTPIDGVLADQNVTLKVTFSFE